MSKQTAIISPYSNDWLVFGRVRKTEQSDRHSRPRSGQSEWKLGIQWTDFH